MNFPTMHAPSLPQGLPSAWLLDCEVFAEAIRPDPVMTVTEWADQRRILSSESTREHGPWRTDRVPHAREIMDALSPNDPCTEVTFVAGTQVAKTEIGNNFIGHTIDVSPAPMMMVLPTSNLGKRNSKTRLAKMIDAMPGLRSKISEKARDSANSASLKQFPGGLLVIAGSNSAAELKSQPVRRIFEDEVDEYPDDVDGQGPADALAEKRTDTYSRNKKIYRASTTTKLGKSKIWKHYQNSDRRRFYVPCPHCQREQVLVWGQFRHETRRVWEIVRADDGVILEVEANTEGAKARDTGELVDVYYECEHCQARIDEHHKDWMFPRGRWIAQAPHVKHHKGYHLAAYYSPLGWFSWRECVRQRLDADKDPTKKLLQAWYNTVDATPFSDDGDKVSHLVAKDRAGAYPYRLGTVPKCALLLTAGVDVQKDRLEILVKGWGRERESALIDYQVIFGDTETSQPWTVLDEYLKKRFPHEFGATLGISAAAIDAGYRTQMVYDFCRPRFNRNIIAVKGQSQAGKSILGRPTKQDIDHRGQKIPNGIDLWPVGSDTAKEDIYARLKIEQPGPGYMHFPLGLPDEYFKGLTCERQVTKYVKGYLRTVWEKDEGDRNEPLDNEGYALAAAMFVGLTRANWDRIEAGLRATAGDLFVAAERAAAEQSAPPPAPEAAPAAPQGYVPPRAGWLTPRGNWLQR
jgi:phage terminase large subunit GpA-like protein